MAVACEAVREVVSTYRFGGECPESSAETAEHLTQCAECRAVLEEVVGAADERLVAAAFTQVKVSDGFAASVLQRLTESDSTAPVANSNADRTGGSSTPNGVAEEDPEIEALLATGRHGGGAPSGRSGMGMVIQHCATCRDRIDTADLKSGSAVQFKGQAYCSSCKADIENNPEYIEEMEAKEAASRRKSGRREAVGSGIHAGMGRRVRSDSSTGGAAAKANPAVLFGGIAAAAVLIAAIGFMMLPDGTQGTDVAKARKDRGSGRSKTKKNRGKTKRASTGGSGGTAVAPPQDEPKELSEAQRMAIERALTELRDKYSEVKDFARKNQQPERWTSVDGQFEELLDSGVWTRKLVQNHEEVVSLREEVTKARVVAKDRFVVAGKDACGTAANRASGYASRGLYPQALKILDGVPPIFRDTEPYKPIAELRTKIIGMIQKAAGEIGKWVTIDHDKWSMPSSQQGQKTVDPDTGGTILSGKPQGALVIFSPAISQLWRDYIVEMEVFATKGESDRAVVQLGMRIISGRKGPEGKAFAFSEQYCNKWIKVRVEAKGSTLTAMVDGQQVLESDFGKFQFGKPLLLMNSGTTLKIKSARFQLNSIHKPR